MKSVIGLACAVRRREEGAWMPMTDGMRLAARFRRSANLDLRENGARVRRRTWNLSIARDGV